MKSTIDTALILKALSDETRLKIIQMLSKEELCGCHILEAFDITQPTLSYHMKILVNAGVVTSRKDGNWTRYRLDNETVSDLNDFFKGLQGHEISVREVDNC